MLVKSGTLFKPVLNSHTAVDDVGRAIRKFDSSSVFCCCVYRMRLCTAVTEFEVERAKSQFKTQLLERLQSTTGASEDIAK